MPRKGARMNVWFLTGIIAITYIAWQINKNRRVIESYYLFRNCRHVIAVSASFNLKIPKHKLYRGTRLRRGSSRKGQRPQKYREIQGARLLRRPGTNNLPRILCLAAVAMAANKEKHGRLTRFDSDASLIRVDNCASYCISNDRNSGMFPASGMRIR